MRHRYGDGGPRGSDRQTSRCNRRDAPNAEPDRQGVLARLAAERHHVRWNVDGPPAETDRWRRVTQAHAGVESQRSLGRPSQSSWGLVAFAFAVGAVSLLGNMVWNCSTCGWDLDGVPWYQALLVAGVPFILAPVVAVAFAVRALALRTRRATTEFLLASLGLALPWAYFLVAS